MNASKDENNVSTLLGVSNVDGTTPVKVYADPVTHRLLVSSTGGGGSGTVTSVAVSPANGFMGNVLDPTGDAVIVLSMAVTGILKSNGTTVSAAVAGTDYVTASSTNTFTNKTYDTAGTGNSFSINGVAVTANTGTGAVVRQASPTLTGTPIIDTIQTSGATGVQIKNSGGTTVATIGASNGSVSTFTGLVTGTAFVPTSSTVPTNGIFLPAANTLGWAVNSTDKLVLTTTELAPRANDGLALGTATQSWSDLFGATGFVLNIANGNWVATHTSGILTVGTGDLRVTTAGTNTASVVTVGGTQTLTSKTLTSPVINTQVSGTAVADVTATNTGTSATTIVTPDGLAGSYAGTKAVSIQVFDSTTSVTTGDGKAYITIPAALNGMNLIRAQATVVTAGTTNATTVMIRNKTDGVDMLSCAISIASGGTVGTVGTINAATDDVVTNDVIGIDVDSVSTTPPQGLMVILEFMLP